MDRDEIAAAVRASGVSCAALARSHGYSQNAVVTALRRPWPAVEAIIASHLGCRPQELWPSRYGADGEPLSGGWTYPSRRQTAAERQTCEAA